MASQLHLLAPEAGGDSGKAEAAGAPPVRQVHRPISARSRAVGRRGLAQAREALQAARSSSTPVITQRPRPSSTNDRRRSAA
jgi:hypothetical protein